MSARAGGSIDEVFNDLLRSIRAVCFDFDGVFTDNTVFVDQNGVESVRCWRGDGLGLTGLRALGLKTLIVSTEVNPVVTVRAQKLQTECLQGVAEKAAAIVQWSQRNQITPSAIAFVGNDINDASALRQVGLPIGVADSHQSILGLIRYRTNTPGGFGAVREVCDLICNAHSNRSAR
jgi:3-deoxy-D-manno-octulosonate 8-phosphate phosphatase (KDO 8-P phosphatase)